ncbi:MAG: PrsW family intramembrane metalloprotease [Candidatus Limnocylindrales bacterium]|jgi:RsiW-degrading membrane proteinase PrsW (M82 family)
MSASVAPTSPGQAAPAPRWGIQASLIQPRQPAFWLFLALLGIGGYLFVDEQSLFSQLPTALTLSWGLVLLYAVPVFVIVYRLDLFEREPKLMIAAAVIWGGVIAVSLAGYANDAWLSVLGKVAPADFTADWGAAVVAPVTEEILKLTGVVVLYLIASSEFDGVMDGFVYGAMVGLGFTVVEDVSYFIQAAVAFGGADQTGPVFDTFLIRVVGGGLYGHVLFAGLTGMGFAYFVTRRQDAFAKRLFVFVALVAAGAGAHFVWDSPWMASVLDVAPGATEPSTVQWVQYGALKGLPFFMLLVLMVLFATRSEEKNFRAIVAPEPDPEVITEAETKSLGSLWSRRAARSAAGRLRGPQGSRLTGQLQAAQIDYAMILSRTDSLTDPALEAQRLKIRGIRAQLAAVQFVPVPAGPAVPVGPAPVAAPVAAPAAPVVTPAASAVAPVAASAATAAAPAVGSKAAAKAAKAVAAEPAPKTEPKPEPGAKAASEAAEKPHPQPERAAAATPAPPPAPPAWAPTHLVPPGGMAAWDAPDPSRPAMLNLPERLELVVESRAGAWAHVRAVNGWRGWVDGRRLVDRG